MLRLFNYSEESVAEQAMEELENRVERICVYRENQVFLNVLIKEYHEARIAGDENEVFKLGNEIIAAIYD